MSAQSTSDSGNDKRYRTLFILWVGFLVTIINLFLITLLVPRSATASETQILSLVLMFAAIVLIAVSFLFKQKILARSVSEQRPQMVLTAYILALAMCDAACIMGMVVFFATDAPYYFLPFIAGLTGMLLHRPRREDFLAASYRQDGKGL